MNVESGSHGLSPRLHAPGWGEGTWALCDEGICLYGPARNPRRALLRCIKHGAILTQEPKFNGMIRKQVRAALEKE